MIANNKKQIFILNFSLVSISNWGICYYGNFINENLFYNLSLALKLPSSKNYINQFNVEHASVYMHASIYSSKSSISK